MIFPAMFFALGFFCAGLAALVLVPPFVRRSTRRAVRNESRRKVKSYQQLQSEKDRLRAEHALRVRKLERRVEHWQNRSRKLLALNGKMKMQMARTGQDMDELTRLADQRYTEIMDLKHEIHQLRLLAEASPSTTAPGKNRTADSPHLRGTDQLTKAWAHRPAHMPAKERGRSVIGHKATSRSGSAGQTPPAGRNKTPRLPITMPPAGHFSTGGSEKTGAGNLSAMAPDSGTTATRKNRRKEGETQTATPVSLPVQGLSQRIRAIRNPAHRH
ncbi:MAG TPA: hypothetical protein ENJ57_05395 [Rhizobiales bacterium]|nr:hypothetical protein [Hyphomicrobiales bacterium]